MKRLWLLLMTLLLGVSTLFAQATKTGTQKAAGKAAATAKAPAKPETGKAASLLDINSASQADLEKLPGIGPVTGKQIVDGRPYKTKRDLLTRKIVGQAEYDKIKDAIVAHQEKPVATDKKK